MKITNIHNLPQEIVDAITNREYSKGDADYSATGLLQPPQLQVLTSWNSSNITTDAADSIWSLFGLAMHNVLESAAGKQQLAEKRLFATLNGVKISGMFDRYDASLFSIDDYKVTSVWKATKGSLYDWACQLNIYRWLFKENYPDMPVEQLRIHAILRDWSFREAKKAAEIKGISANRVPIPITISEQKDVSPLPPISTNYDGGYPLTQILTLNIPMWEIEETIEFITNRINRVEEAKATVNATELFAKAPCSIEDRWAKADGWAVFSPSKNRTQKLFISDEHMTLEMCKKEAQLKVAGMTAPGYQAILRKGESIRCENFCLVKSFCAQYRAATTNEVKSDTISIEKAVEELSNDK